MSTVPFWCPTKSCHSPRPHPLFITTFLRLSVKREERLSPPRLHLLSSPLLHECWGVGGGRPWAGHPVRGLLTVPGLSAGAYWREIHINTCLLCLPPLDTARLPAWHRQHCMGLLSRQRGDGASMRAWHLSADLLSVLLLHWWTRVDNADFEKAHFLVLLVSLIPSVVSLDHIWPAEFTACRFLQQAERKEAAEVKGKCVRAKTHVETICDVDEFVKYAAIDNMCPGSSRLWQTINHGQNSS